MNRGGPARLRLLLPATCFVLLVSTSAPRHVVADGTPITAFGTDGVLIDPVVAGANVLVSDVADDDDGRLVVAGAYNLPGDSGFSQHWFVMRYLRSGARDSSFGANGFVELPNPSQHQVITRAVATLPDRSILVGAQCMDCAGLVRVSPDGSNVTAVGSRPSVSDLAELPDRRVVAIGTSGYPVHIAMAIQPSGAIDPSFGGQLPGFLFEEGTVLSTRNGILLAAVVVHLGQTGLTCALVKFDSNGNLDLQFGGTGVVELATETGPGPFSCLGVTGSDARTLMLTRVSSGTAATLVDTAGRIQAAPWPVTQGSPTVGYPPLPKVLADGVGRYLEYTPQQSTVRAVHLDETVDVSFGQGGTSTFPAQIDNAKILETGDLVVLGGQQVVSTVDPRPLIVQLVSLPAGLAPQPPISQTTKFVPLPPQRILDTRRGLGAPEGKVPAAHEVDLQVAGTGGVPSSGAVAVVLNVTATEATQPGFITVYPTGTTRPFVSNLNVERADDTVPNLVTARVGIGGKVTVFVQTTTHLIADVAGYYTGAASSTDGRFHGVTPKRILDTRTGVGAPAALVPQGGQITLQVRGVDPVPAAGVSAVVLNVTATEAVQPGFVTVWPGGALPVVSNLNVVAGDTRPNLVIVPLAPDGTVSLFTSGGTHLIADLAGWFTDDTAPQDVAGLFVPLSEPARILDTRQYSATPFPVATHWNVQAAATTTLPPIGVGAIALNATTTETQAPGFVTLWPASATQPVVSNLNATHPQQTVPNAAIVALGANRLAAYSTSGGHLILDVTGWYTAQP